MRAAACSAAHAASSRGTTTTPSSSAQITSPALTIAPPSTTGTLTDPGDALTVPSHDTWRDHTGKPISRRSSVSRTPASITRPRTPRAITEVASSSPNIPCVDGAVLATTRMSPSSTHLDGGVDHQVVAGMARHGDRRRGEPYALLDRADVRPDDTRVARSPRGPSPFPPRRARRSRLARRDGSAGR